jgi:hypothetical protein
MGPAVYSWCLLAPGLDVRPPRRLCLQVAQGPGYAFQRVLKWTNPIENEIIVPRLQGRQKVHAREPKMVPARCITPYSQDRGRHHQKMCRSNKEQERATI